MTLAPYVYEAVYAEMTRRGLSSVKAAIREVLLDAAGSKSATKRAFVLAELRAEMRSG